VSESSGTGSTGSTGGGHAVRTLVVDDEPLARDHLRALLEARGDIEVIGECGDGRTAVAQIRREQPELVLLDIQMPELDGLGVVREVGPASMPTVIFVTAYDEYALAAFDAHAVDYLMKPVNRDRFTLAIDRAVALIGAGMGGAGGGGRASYVDTLARVVERLHAARSGPERIAVREQGRVLFLRVDDIDWVEAADDHVRFHIGKTVFAHRDTLSRVEQRLPASKFLRIHRSTLVNVERIREVQPWFQGDWVAILIDGTRLTSGRSYRARVRAFLDRAL
jgi:two-component system LytT family response regulator